MENIIEFPVITEEEKLIEEIKDAVYSHSGKISIAGALGCIEIAKRIIEEELFDDE